MEYMVTKLNDIIKKSTNGSKKLNISETLKNLKVDDIVLVGGEIKAIITIDEKDHSMLFLDDSIGEIRVSVSPEILKEFPERFNPGNIVIIKGRLKENIYPEFHPEVRNKKEKYVLCTAVRVIEP